MLLQKVKKVLHLDLDPLVEVDVGRGVKIRDQLHQVVGGVGGLTAALQLTLQIPKQEKDEDNELSAALDIKPVDEPGDLISEESQGGIISHIFIHFIAWG